VGRFSVLGLGKAIRVAGLKKSIHKPFNIIGCLANKNESQWISYSQLEERFGHSTLMIRSPQFRYSMKTTCSLKTDSFDHEACTQDIGLITHPPQQTPSSFLEGIDRGQLSLDFWFSVI
jgi:hypothetical protein